MHIYISYFCIDEIIYPCFNSNADLPHYVHEDLVAFLCYLGIRYIGVYINGLVSRMIFFIPILFNRSNRAGIHLKPMDDINICVLEMKTIICHNHHNHSEIISMKLTGLLLHFKMHTDLPPDGISRF